MSGAPLFARGISGTSDPNPAASLVADDFAVPVRAGHVVGSATEAGLPRRGADRESVVSIRDGALRIRPLVIPGWGRAGISYGPFERRNGLGLAVHVLNGENGAQAYKLASFHRRLGRWALGSGTDSLWTRLLRMPFRLSGESFVRKLRYWHAACHDERAYRPMRENLAVGWFDAEAPVDATKSGDAFVVRGAGPLNGELNVCVSDRLMPVIPSLPNVPVYYFLLLRGKGCAYYIASHDHVAGTGAYPTIRPIAIDAASTSASVFPGVHQAMVGEAGFSAETVLYGVHVAAYSGLDNWYGTAHAADRLVGDGSLAERESETGIGWRVLLGGPRRAAGGARIADGHALAWLVPEQPSGLIHAVATMPDGKGAAGIVWRATELSSYVSLSVSAEGFELATVAGGERRVLRSGSIGDIDVRQPMALQVRDDGNEIDASVNGCPIVRYGASSDLPASGLGVGFVLDARGGGDPRIGDFEAHPRLVQLAPALPLAVPWARDGEIPVVADKFAARRDDLDGYASPNGVRWTRIMGQCRFALPGDGGVAVMATPDRPAANRTAYCVDWPDPDFADVATVIVPPGEGRGKNHSGARRTYILGRREELFRHQQLGRRQLQRHVNLRVLLRPRFRGHLRRRVDQRERAARPRPAEPPQGRLRRTPVQDPPE